MGSVEYGSARSPTLIRRCFGIFMGSVEYGSARSPTLIRRCFDIMGSVEYGRLGALR